MKHISESYRTMIRSINIMEFEKAVDLSLRYGCVKGLERFPLNGMGTRVVKTLARYEKALNVLQAAKSPKNCEDKYKEAVKERNNLICDVSYEKRQIEMCEIAEKLRV